MSGFETLSIKEKLDKRMELRGKMNSIIDGAGGSDKLSGEDTADWEKLDADVMKLTGLIDKHRDVAAKKERLSQIDEDIAKDPGRQTKPTNPGSQNGLSNGDVTEIQLRGQTLKIGDDPKLKPLGTADYHKKFESFLRGGKGESLGMMTGDNSRGGYLAAITFVSELLKAVDDLVFMRKLGRVFQTNGAVSLGVLSWDADPADADWTPEVPAADMSEDDNARVGKREMIPHGLSKLLKLSQKMTRAAIIPIVEMVRQRMAYKFALPAEKAYLTGDGVDKPLGVFYPSVNGVPTSRDVETGTNNDFNFDDCINMFYSLKAPYQNKATWLAAREWFKRARKLKSSATGDYLWQPAPALGAPDTILTRPYVISEFCPCQTANDFTGGAYPAIVGDFSFYWMADSLQMEIQVILELFTLRNQVGYKGWWETDGQPVMAEAFSRMKLKTAG